MSVSGRIFVSYRREGGAEMARLIRDSLQNRGFHVFMDVEDLRSGKFNEALLREIDASQDVVVILSPGSLDRCFTEGDWLRWEVAHAIARDKNVVSVITRGFVWPTEPLPEDIKQLPYFQGIEPSHSLFTASIDKLTTLLKSRPSPWTSHRLWLTSGIASLALVVAIVAWLASKGPRDAGPTRQESVTTTGPKEGAPARQQEVPPPEPEVEFEKHLCFIEDDWQRGTAMLAQKPGMFQEAAAAEVRGPGQAGEAELARLWVAAAAKAKVPDKWHCYRRARHWFRLAMANSALKENPGAIKAIAAELDALPVLKAKLQLQGTSPFRERLQVRRSSTTWLSDECNGGNIEFASFPAFSLTGGGTKSRVFSGDAMQRVLPAGIDFTTAKVHSASFRGATGRASQILDFRVLPNGKGFDMEFGEINAAKVRYPGTFTFNIVITIGE